MEIITIFGDQNTGKTTLITSLFHHLVFLGATFSCKFIGRDKRDIQAKIIYNNKTITFYSIGDYANKKKPEKYIQDGFNFAKNEKSDYYINAYSTGFLKKDDYLKIAERHTEYKNIEFITMEKLQTDSGIVEQMYNSFLKISDLLKL